ncbi:MAG TPA: peptidyl-prolyl cis-trans isomerase [Polyangia bacterium]|jgi:parvulin-like peptidyl-prolyl isomerase
MRRSWTSGAKLVRVAMGAVLLATGAACGPRATPPAAVVAEWDGLVVRTDELTAALAQAPASGAASDHRARVTELVTDVLLEEARARAAGADPAAALRARAAAREAAIRLLVAPDAVPPAGADEAFFSRHLAELGQPARAALGQIRLATCGEAERLKRQIQEGAVSFEVAALRFSLDRASAVTGGDLGLTPEAELPAPVRSAIEAVRPAGEPVLVGPVTVSGGCLLVKVRERHPPARPSFTEVKGIITARVAAQAEGAARRALVAKLGGTGRAVVDETALAAALRTDGTADAATPVVTLDTLRVTVAEVRARARGRATLGPGGPAAARQALAEELVLWREAQRRGLEHHAAVRAAARAALVDEYRARIEAEITPGALTTAQLEEHYTQNRARYSEPRRVRVASLVARDRARAERWAKELRASPYPTTRFEALLAAESEDVAARRTGGDMGWVDARAEHLPDIFRHAVLNLRRPGEVAGPLLLHGTYLVVLCRDVTPERVTPLAEVEAEVRAALTARDRRRALGEREGELRRGIRPRIDWAAADRLAGAGKRL